MRIKINRPVQVTVNGQLRQFYRGETPDIPEDAVRRIERLLAGRRIPGDGSETTVSAPAPSATLPLGASAGAEAVEPDAGEGAVTPPPVAPLASDKSTAPEAEAPAAPAKPKAPRKSRAKKA